MRIFDVTNAVSIELDDRGPNILDLLHVAPSRSAGRSLNDKIRIITGGEPVNLFGKRGLAIIEAGGYEAAVAIAYTLIRWSDIEESEKVMSLSIIGQAMIDGLGASYDSNILLIRSSHEWAQELELLLKVSPASDPDKELLIHFEMIAQAGGYHLEDLSKFLKKSFSLVEVAQIPRWTGGDLDLEADLLFYWEQAALMDLPEFDAPFKPRPFKNKIDNLPIQEQPSLFD